jgi:hypothetical protein
MNSCPRPAPRYSNTPLTRFCSFFLVPLQYDAVHYSAERFVILNEVKDLTIDAWTTG